jgi:DNA excision repair protein ERCC-4
VIAANTVDTATFPHTVLIDTREQAPYGFTGLRTDAKQGKKPLVIPTRRETLVSGDYTVGGFAERIAVERKSLEDFFGTLTRGRDRFERELDRLNAMEFAAVVVEANWLQILQHPPERSRLNPKSVYRSVIAWQQRFSRVHWWMLEGRRLGEVTTFRILERFLKEHTKR